ncbi:aldo/keto reductase [Candidatus Saccharibacteria bacterium]|nr:aldo/keto reductase [Calditrichia bacterium]NIV97764.1 aldo/keto reductase [Candidatus Saccharibacteria bacterium]
MRYKLVGKSGLRVSELCLGTMTFGEEWGWGASKEESRKIFDTFVEAGGNFIDTANRYTEGSSEKFVGEFIAKARERFVVATKFTLYTRHGDVNACGNHRKNIMQSVEGSLKRINTDYIDLYWLHAWDFTAPVEEVMRALDDLVRAGKVLYIGVSDTPAWIVSQANTLAELHGWSSFVGLQIEYSLIERTPERDLLPMARAFDIGVTPWAPLGAGVLTGKYNPQYGKKSEEKRMGEDSKRLSNRNLRIAEEVVKISEEIGCSPSQVAINWVRQQKGIMIPIIGARKVSQIQDNLQSLAFRLSDEHLQRLDEVSKIELGFPHEFLQRDHIKNLVYGGMHDAIDNHRR